MPDDYTYIKRCLELAAKGSRHVAPNPMVGAVLVHAGRIIGEGWHRQYGGPHAEVNCIDSVKPEEAHLIGSATMYVSLEPCSHYGKTPPCADLIIQQKIKKVVIGCVDSFAKVNGGGIAKLRNAGVEVVLGNWQEECRTFNKRFFTFHEKKRPYIILKWAQTANRKIAPAIQIGAHERLFISNDLSDRLVHQWRSEEAAIMVGKNTALLDNPSLTNRLWSGKNPVRMVMDKKLELPSHLSIFNNEAKTFIFNQLKDETAGHLHYIKIAFEENVLQQVLNQCFEHNIQSLIVEGGARLLQSFVDEGLWDECRTITAKSIVAPSGLDAPVLRNAVPVQSYNLLNDEIVFYTPVGTK